MMENSQTDVQARVKRLMAEVFAVSPELIGDELAYGDLPQWDSLGHMDVMMALETEFGVEINADTIAELVSLPAICAYIEDPNHV